MRKTIYVHPVLLNYMVDLVQATRKKQSAVAGVSPRGSLALLNAVRAWAMLHGRSYPVVLHDQPA